MRTLTEKYNGVLRGVYSKDQFLREARMQQPHLVTQHNSYQDAINILKNKGLISEVSVEEGSYKPIEYRDCLIEPGPYGAYEWYRPGWVDSNDEGGTFWSGIGGTVEDCKNQIDDYYAEYGEGGESDIEEKKLTPAEKKGKEKIVKGLKKSGMSKDDPSTYAIATAKAKELYENLETMDFSNMENMTPRRAYEYTLALVRKLSNSMDPQQKDQFISALKSLVASDSLDELGSVVSNLAEGVEEVDKYYYDVLAKISEYAKSLDDEDAYAFHEKLKAFFNRLFEEQGSGSKLKVGDVIDHKGKKKKVVRIDGNRVFLQPVDSTGGGVEIDRQLGVASANEQSSDWPQEVPSLYGDIIFRLVKVMADRAKYELINKETGETWELGGRVYGNVDQLKADAANTIMPLGGIQSSRFESTINENDSEEEQDIHMAKYNARAMSKESGTKKFVVEKEKTIIVYVVQDEPEPGNTIAGYEDGAPIAGLTESTDKVERKAGLPLDVLQHGIRFELEKKGKFETATEEDYQKALKTATKNLEKDLLHYKKEEGATEAPESKDDQMAKVKLKEGIKKIIRKILTEESQPKRKFNINGKLL